MLHAVVAQLAVDLIGQHDQVVLDAELGDAFEILLRRDRAGRVGREIEHQHAALRRDRGGEFLRFQREAVLLAGLDRHRLAVGHDDARTVGNVAGLVVDHLFARIEQRAQREIDRLGHADGDEHLGRRVVRNVEEPADVARDRLAQRKQAEVRGVGRLAFFQRVDGGLADVPRGDEVRLADAQRDHAFAALHEFEEITDAGARNARDMPGDFGRIVHGNRDREKWVRKAERAETPASHPVSALLGVTAPRRGARNGPRGRTGSPFPYTSSG